MASTLTERILQTYAEGYSTFIETGTSKGDGLQVALDYGFKHLYSVEANPEVFAKATARFVHNNDVLIVHGDGAQSLEQLLSGINEPAVFWLDSHWSTGEDKLPAGASPCPLLGELRAIAAHKVKGHLIMIDDCRYFWRGIEQWQGINMSDIIQHIMGVDPGYWITFEKGVTPNDILIAKMAAEAEA